MSQTKADQSALAFWDRAAPKYARKPIANMPAYEEKLALVATYLGPADRVLEIGCGTGGTALRLAPGVAEITATDISATMIEIAEAKLGPGQPGNVTFHKAAAGDPVSGAPFDAILAFSLLHLMPDLAGTLARIRDQLRPGGVFISKTVCLGEMNILIRALVWVMRLVGYAPPVMILNRDQVLAALRDAGFEVERIVDMGSIKAAPVIIARKR